MFKFEKIFLDIITKYKDKLFLLVISILGLFIRYQGIHFISWDMKNFLIPWYNVIDAKGGLHSLGTQVGDYNILYQTFVALITYLHRNCVVMYKILSILFDYILAVSAGLLCMRLTKKNNSFIFSSIYSIVLFLPTVILNSSYWGQCDSIYTTFVILTLLFLFEEKYLLSFIMLGLGFSFKFQTIFIVPFIICYYVYKKRFSIMCFLASVGIFWLSGLPAYLNGRNLLAPFKIYANQTGTYKQMSISAPSFWILIGDDYKLLHQTAIILTVALCGIALYLIMSGIINLENATSYMAAAARFTWPCPLFLPAMHERYTYLLDILLVVLTFMDNKYLKYAAISILISIITNCASLFGTWHFAIQWCIIACVLAWVHFTYTLLNDNKNSNQEEIATEQS